jgi:tetratricopeptide (TPR) repeat protein
MTSERNGTRHRPTSKLPSFATVFLAARYPGILLAVLAILFVAAFRPHALAAEDTAELSRQAAAAMRAQKFAEAETRYRKLAELEPANPMWRMNLGLALYSAGRYAHAVAEFEAFLKAKPEPGPVHLLLGTSLLKLSRPCPAIAMLEKAVQWNKDRSSLELADAYYGCKRFERAARTYEAAARTATAGAASNRAISRQAAHCYWQARLYPDARRIFQTLEPEFANEPEFQYEFGDTLARMDGPEAGLPYLEKAVAAKPALIAARGELGKALLATGDAAGAIPHLEAAARNDATLLLPLSRAYRGAGREADAERTQKEYRQRVNGK